MDTIHRDFVPSQLITAKFILIDEIAIDEYPIIARFGLGDDVANQVGDLHFGVGVIVAIDRCFAMRQLFQQLIQSEEVRLV